ncbi:MAG: sigma 54-interacting transcriptional regulator [Planctomycetota bacterium]
MSILFLCNDNAVRSPMAEAIALEVAGDAARILSAGTAPADRVDPEVVGALAEIGLVPPPDAPRAFGDVALNDITVVISLCRRASQECRLRLPGQPVRIDWDLPDPHGMDGVPFPEAVRTLRDEIRRLVQDFFQRGYLQACREVRGRVELILDSLNEGIIAHDLDRRILYFNQAAERITGFHRPEVLGKDCHDVFPGRFCGPDCSFCETGEPNLACPHYTIHFTTKSGEPRYLDMSVTPIRNDTDDVVGALATFRDLTHEHELARRLGEIESFSGIIGRDRKMLELFDLIRSVADTSAPVLVQGDSGTGKELVAAAIHNESPRFANRFVTVNCGALPEGLLESELFGHVRGAFTGAVRDKKGRFELADGGTIFLDEIGDISPAMQVKLLRVLQEGAFEPVGGQTTRKVDVRVISATNKDLQEEIGAGRFREDLFYRLCVVPIQLPPLRERRADIPLLVDAILHRFATQEGRDGVRLAPEALGLMMEHDWPGNVRELQNAIQYALVRCKGSLIEAAHLPPNVHGSDSIHPPQVGAGAGPSGAAAAPAGAGDADDGGEDEAPRRGRRRKLTRDAVEAALREAGDNRSEAARLLGVGRATLYRFLRAHDMV